jgi:hypothetical protein
MGRTLLTVVLLVAVTQAQVGVSAVSQPQPVAMDPTVASPPWIEVFPQYLKLRRGTEEKVLLVPALSPTSDGGTATYWGAPGPQHGRLVATELKIEVTEGFTSSAIKYPRSREISLGSNQQPVRLLGPDSVDLHFKVRADRTVDLGDHALRGKLRFQRVSKVGVSVPQELEFLIPIRVVEHNAKVAYDGRYHEEVPLAAKIAIIVSWPIIFPFALHGR